MSPPINFVFGFLDVYWAPDGEAMPAIGASPAGNWTQIGGSDGARRYSEDGIRITTEMQHSEFRSLESLRPEAVVPTAHEMMVTLELQNMELEQVRNAFGYNSVTTNAGVDKVLSLDFTSMPVRAILVRGAGKSSEISGQNCQFEFEHCVEIGAKEMAFVKDDPAILEIQFKVLAGTNSLRMGIT